MRAWMFGSFGAGLLLTACEQHMPPGTQNAASNLSQTAPAKVVTAVSAPAQRTLEIAGYDETIVLDPDGEQPVEILCDPERYRLSIRVAGQGPLDRSYPARLVVPIDSLIQDLPSYYTEGQYRGELIRYAQCGALTVRLRGSFYNNNSQGELGAYPSFATVSIFAENRTIAPDRGGGIAIGECERGAWRGPDCPADWAVRVDVDYKAKRDKALVVEHVSSVAFMDASPEGRQRSERRYEAEALLSLWEHARDARKAQASGTP